MVQRDFCSLSIFKSAWFELNSKKILPKEEKWKNCLPRRAAAAVSRWSSCWWWSRSSPFLLPCCCRQFNRHVQQKATFVHSCWICRCQSLSKVFAIELFCDVPAHRGAPNNKVINTNSQWGPTHARIFLPGHSMNEPSNQQIFSRWPLGLIWKINCESNRADRPELIFMPTYRWG